MADSPTDTANEAAEEPRPENPLRRCIVMREERPKADLIRFVVDPDGRIVADLAGHLPGRGVWVTAEQSAVATAIKSQAFAKSLKRPVDIPPELTDVILRQLVKRALESLSLANKAGLLTTGFAQVFALIESGKVAVLLHGAEAAEDGRAKLDRKFSAIARNADRAPRIVSNFTIDQLSLAIGRTNVVHAALVAGGATERFMREAERAVRFGLGSGIPNTSAPDN